MPTQQVDSSVGHQPAVVRPLAFGPVGFFLPGLVGQERELRIQAEGLLVPPWTDAEINRFLLRVGMFERRGMRSDDAEAMAERCLNRDRGMDDRRSCIECAHRQGSGFCAATKLPVFPTEIFHRCHRFGWQVPKQEKQA